jgi:NAD(P)-dependent dehydrogenase (short-subunit alcohol dehydrogenase family)
MLDKDNPGNHPPKGVAVIGASRGLGAAIVAALHKMDPASPILGISRKQAPSCHWSAADLSTDAGQEAALKALGDFAPATVICCVGGGPFGAFAAKAWRDHQWSYQVSLLFPARLAHWALGFRPYLRQLVLVGSSVAEDQADPGAGSYSSAKHGLRGLHATLVREEPKIDVRLYSPGYMDTHMLPPNAHVRQRPIWRPEDVAGDLLEWLENGPVHDHRRLAVFPPGR